VFNEKLKVLIVDEVSPDLAAVQSALKKAEREWEISFCARGENAATELQTTQFDAILISAKLPDISGAELCQQARTAHPSLVRIVVCSDKSEEFAVRSKTSAHNFLSRPFTAQELVNTVVRACSLKEFTRSKSVLNVVSQVKRLPTLPQNYQKISQLLQQDDVSITDIAHIINQDVAMVAKILQLANSAIFGARRKPVSSAQSGVKMLGVDNLKLLVLAVEVFSQLDDKACANFRVEDLWEHCMTVGSAAQKIARTLSTDKDFISDSMTAGTLHDLGKLVLINHFPSEYAKVLQLTENQKLSTLQAERAVFGTSHAEVGAYLLGNWSLPHAIVEAVAYHHEPQSCARQELSPLTAVYAANVLVNAAQRQGDGVSALEGDAYLQGFNLSARFAEWNELSLSSSPS